MKRRNRQAPFERFLLSALAGMAVLFFSIYLILSQQPGIVFCDVLLLRHEQGEGVSYSGKVYGQKVEFLVSEGGAVTYVVDGRVRGPYTVVLDSSAAPEDSLAGGEVRLGEEVLFRGGWRLGDGLPFLADETGEPLSQVVTEVSGQVEPARQLPQDPSVSFLLRLILAPELQHRGRWECYALGMGLSLLAAGWMAFADQLFRWRLHWRIRNPERVQPSEWELLSRKTGWVVLSGVALVLYIFGALTY